MWHLHETLYHGNGTLVTACVWEGLHFEPPPPPSPSNPPLFSIVRCLLRIGAGGICSKREWKKLARATEDSGHFDKLDENFWGIHRFWGYERDSFGPVEMSRRDAMRMRFCLLIVFFWGFTIANLLEWPRKVPKSKRGARLEMASVFLFTRYLAC